jgi:hypothetical protein
MNYRVRSIIFAANSFAAHAKENSFVNSGARRVILSGKNNGVNPLIVMRKAAFSRPMRRRGKLTYD